MASSEWNPADINYSGKKKDNISEIKQRVTKAASEGLSKMAHSKQIVKMSPTAAVLSTIGPAPKRPNSLWSFNNFNSVQILTSIRNNSGPNVPATVQEQTLITELLYCLVGIRGTNIWPELSDTSIDDFQPLKFHINESIQISYQDIIQEILPLASHYSLVQKFIQQTTSSTCGYTLQALSAALRHLMHDYYMSLVQFESHCKLNSMSLHKLLYFLRPTMNIFEVLADTVTTICQLNVRGAKVLSYLYDKISSLTGDTNAQEIISHLMELSAVPYVEMLQLWILKGVIIDPHHEFLVEDNDIIIQQQNNHNTSSDTVNHYSAEYWEKRYTIRSDCIPQFLNGYSDIILRTGKYLNVIRQCGNQIHNIEQQHNNHKSMNNLKFSPNNPNMYITFIQESYTFASKTLLELLVKDNDLMGHLLSVKRYLLLHQGDFINQFMDASEKELGKNVDKVLPMKLENLLGLTLRLSSTKYDAYKDDLHCQLFPFELYKQMSKIHLIGHIDEEYWKNNKIDLTGMQCFAFRYEVRWPISLVLNHIAICQYQMLFRQLFLCKHVERQLCRVWKDNNNTKKFAPDTAEQYRSAFTLRQRMMNAIQNIEYYMMIEVIEPTWHTFVEKIERVENVDEVLLVHQDFLDDCLHNCMLKDPELLRLIGKLCDICLSFCKFIQKAQQYFIDAELTSMLCSDNSSDSGSDVDLLSSCKQNESSLAPTETFSERVKRFDLEFTFVLIGLLKQINELFYDNPASKLMNLVHRINFNSFYTDQLEQMTLSKETVESPNGSK